MKNLTTPCILFILTVITTGGYAQCNNEEFVTASVSALAPGFSLLKSYKINGEKDLEKVEFSYVLTKGTQYMLNLKDKNPNPSTVVTLYDSKRNKVASNKISGAIAGAIAFSCGATGIYYITYTFEPGSERCAGSTLGFQR
jgi:hypothetical protein